MAPGMFPQWVPELTPGSIGIWSLLTVVSVALIKAWPVIQLQVIQAKEKLRGEHRSDLSDCQKHIEKLQREMNELGEQVHQIEMKLLGAIAAYRILDAEVEAVDPKSRALAQARRVMSAAFTMSPSTDASFVVPEGLR